MDRKKDKQRRRSVRILSLNSDKEEQDNILIQNFEETYGSIWKDCSPNYEPSRRKSTTGRRSGILKKLPVPLLEDVETNDLSVIVADRVESPELSRAPDHTSANNSLDVKYNTSSTTPNQTIQENDDSLSKTPNGFQKNDQITTPEDLTRMGNSPAFESPDYPEGIMILQNNNVDLCQSPTLSTKIYKNVTPDNSKTMHGYKTAICDDSIPYSPSQPVFSTDSLNLQKSCLEMQNSVLQSLFDTNSRVSSPSESEISESNVLDEEKSRADMRTSANKQQLSTRKQSSKKHKVPIETPVEKKKREKEETSTFFKICKSIASRFANVVKGSPDNSSENIDRQSQGLTQISENKVVEKNKCEVVESITEDIGTCAKGFVIDNNMESVCLDSKKTELNSETADDLHICMSKNIFVPLNSNSKSESIDCLENKDFTGLKNKEKNSETSSLEIEIEKQEDMKLLNSNVKQNTIEKTSLRTCKARKTNTDQEICGKGSSQSKDIIETTNGKEQSLTSLKGDTGRKPARNKRRSVDSLMFPNRSTDLQANTCAFLETQEEKVKTLKKVSERRKSSDVSLLRKDKFSDDKTGDSNKEIEQCKMLDEQKIDEGNSIVHSSIFCKETPYVVPEGSHIILQCSNDKKLTNKGNDEENNMSQPKKKRGRPPKRKSVVPIFLLQIAEETVEETKHEDEGSTSRIETAGISLQSMDNCCKTERDSIVLESKISNDKNSVAGKIIANTLSPISKTDDFDKVDCVLDTVTQTNIDNTCELQQESKENKPCDEADDNTAEQRNNEILSNHRHCADFDKIQEFLAMDDDKPAVRTVKKSRGKRRSVDTTTISENTCTISEEHQDGELEILPRRTTRLKRRSIEVYQAGDSSNYQTNDSESFSDNNESPNSSENSSTSKQKTVRKRKMKEENIEDIYRNKNFKRPGERIWETIYESPNQHKNPDQLLSKKRFKRTIGFETVLPTKLKKRTKKATENGWDTKVRKKQQLTDEFVIEKLSKLDGLLNS